MPIKQEFVAHIRTEDNCQIIQSVYNHLEEVANFAAKNASKIGLAKVGELIGLLHDFGKYSQAFQNYIGSATGTIDQDEDEYVDAGKLKGKIDHSTAGAKYIWNIVKNETPQKQAIFQLLVLCIASHHSGLIDCLTIEGENAFNKRMGKPDERCHLTEITGKVEDELLKKINNLLTDGECVNEIVDLLKRINQINNNEILKRFQAGLSVRMLFSCLIDADRTDTANFENPEHASLRQDGNFVEWDVLIDRLEKKLQDFENKPDKTPIDGIRKKISDACLTKANDATGVFTLTVPTGGGKTLASLRFALHHAKKHHLDRIVFVIPYTSIIDQNARIVRDILELEKSEKGKIVLEHHSNLLPELQNWKTKILSENWDAPIIYTTSVQLLETLFSGGTRSARRMHQLARSVIVFDEIQTLPIKTTHLFCNAINFLTNHCYSSVVLCTATQPLLNKVNEEKGCIRFSEKNEIMPDVETLFNNLKRVEVINKIKPTGWETKEVAQLAIEQIDESRSCLIIVNTKKNAREIYEELVQHTDLPIFHLSTSMCPAHRMVKLNEIRIMLEENAHFICVSTQLIEAGVDIDFGSVIRFVAGIDSIAQAAGRCNRNGNRPSGKVFVINPKDESIDSLHDIKTGRDISNRIFNELNNPGAGLPNDLIHPKVMERYFQYYFYNRANEMDYKVDIGRNDTLLNLLSNNSFSVGEYSRINGKGPQMYFQQAFATAGKEFNAIDAPTQGIVVPYSKKGQKLVTDLFSQFAVEQQYKLLKNAQKYTVNAFPNVIKKLTEQKAIREVPEIGVLVLSDPRYYHPQFGLDTEIKIEYEPLIN
jgi:CRISPR-associated endonuclease/helicase Cas3